MKLSLHVILGGAAMLALVITLAFGRQSPAPVAPVAVAPVEEPLKKQDRVPMRDVGMEALRLAMTEKRVQTETIRPEPPAIIPPIVQVQEEEPAPKPRRRIKAASPKRSGDICSRHGLRKVQYGKRWRCRK